MSLPRPIGLRPVATAAASPPLDPPTVSSGRQGLSVRPCRGLSVHSRMAISETFVRPIGIAPARRIRATQGASRYGVRPRSAGIPSVVGDPRQSRLALIVKGTPCSGPRTSARSAASAAARASSAKTSTIALIRPLIAPIRSRCASTIARLDAAPVRTRSAS